MAGLQQVRQLNPPCQMLAYNNAAVVLAGYVIEAITGQPYEHAVQEHLLTPLGLDHTFFVSDEILGHNVAASHDARDGAPVVEPS